MVFLRETSVEKERRQNDRIDFSGQLAFQIAAEPDTGFSPEVVESVAGAKPTAVINNISPQGFCLTLDHPLQPYQIIRVNFPVHRPDMSIPTLGEVRWVRPIPEQNQYRVGVRFLI